jgi:hypothetical protein
MYSFVHLLPEAVVVICEVSEGKMRVDLTTTLNCALSSRRTGGRAVRGAEREVAARLVLDEAVPHGRARARALGGIGGGVVGKLRDLVVVLEEEDAARVWCVRSMD